MNLRQNAIQIDGAQSGDLFGLGTTGQPGAQANAKSIPLDAVKEYQVLLSPFDVRQGNFGGLLINAVTKSGTNELHGSVYAYTRNQNLTRTQPYLNDYSQQQYGVSLGGPILQGQAVLLRHGELQRCQTPAIGSVHRSRSRPVRVAGVDRRSSRIMATYGFADAGTGEQVRSRIRTGTSSRASTRTCRWKHAPRAAPQLRERRQHDVQPRQRRRRTTRTSR